MKKFLSILISIILVLSVMPTASIAAEEDSLKITVANDLHLDLVSAKAEKVEKTNTINADYPHASNGGQLHYESEAIIDSFFSTAAENDSDYLLLVGDLTHHGTKEEHLALSEKLMRFEALSGKKVFVAPGNHDYRDTTPEQFMDYYSEFGYGDAIELHEENASYVAELDSEYRLLVIDANVPGEDRHGMTEELKQWITAQGEKAIADGKKMIAAIHHNFVEHIFLGGTLYNGSVIKEKEYGIGELFASLGIRYTFTGHTHQHDVASFTAKDGTKIYSVVTSSLNAYPCPYRNVSFGDKVEITTEKVQSIDTSVLPSGITDVAMKAAQEDFQAYAKTCTYTGLKYRLYACTTAEGILTLTKIEDEQMKAILEKVGTRLEKVLNMPIYEKDAQAEGESVEALAKMYKTTLPETEFATILDLLTYFYQSNSEGDEYNPAYSNEVILLTRTVAVALNYTLAEVSDEEFAQALSFASGLLGVKLSADLFMYVGSGLKRFEGCEIFVTTAVIPFIREFGTDNAPADNNVTLEGYTALGEPLPEKDFFSVIFEFIKALLETLKTLLALLPW